MRKIISSVVAILAFVALGGTAAFATDVAQEYNQCMAGYFAVTPEVVTELMETGISVDEAPVALFLSQKTGLKAVDFVKMRQQGGSWAEIAKMRGVQPGDFYVIAVGRITSPTFKPIFAKFKETPVDQWRRLELTDSDIVNLVALKFISSHHDYSMFKTMEIRDNGAVYSQVNHEVQERKAAWVRAERERRLAPFNN